MDAPDEKDAIKLAERDIKYLLEKTDFCIAIQDPRHYLNGLLLSCMMASCVRWQLIVIGLL